MRLRRPRPGDRRFPVPRLLPLLAAVALGACTGGRAEPVGSPARGEEGAGGRAGAGLRAVVVSDLNESYGTVGYAPEVPAVVDRIVYDWRPDVVIVAGDLIAGQDPDLSDARVRAMWEAFDSVVARPLSAAGIPLLAALGNHDASAYPAHARDRRLAVEHWRGREASVGTGAIDASGLPLRYTARYGDVFFAVWDATNQESARDPDQLAWLAAALRSPEARSAAHRVVVGHLPLYPVAIGRDRPGEFLVRGDSLRRELEALGVTLFVSGHHHAYYPGRRGALTLLHAGAIGSGPRPLIGADRAFKAIALLEFGRDSVRVAGHEAEWRPGAGLRLREIPITSLPPAICSGPHRVVRRDLPDAASACPGAGSSADPTPPSPADPAAR